MRLPSQSASWGRQCACANALNMATVVDTGSLSVDKKVGQVLGLDHGAGLVEDGVASRLDDTLGTRTEASRHPMISPVGVMLTMVVTCS